MNYRRNKALALSLVLGALVAIPTQSHAMFKAFVAAAVRMSTRKLVRPVVALSAGATMLQTKLQQDMTEQSTMLSAGATPATPLKRTDVIIKSIAKIEYEIHKDETLDYKHGIRRGGSSYAIYSDAHLLKLGHTPDRVGYYGPYSMRGSQHTVEKGSSAVVIHTSIDLDSSHPIAEDIRKNGKSSLEPHVPLTVDDEFTTCTKFTFPLTQKREVQCRTKQLLQWEFRSKMDQYLKEFSDAETSKSKETVKEPNEK